MTDYRSVVVALKANVRAWVAGMVEAGASVETLKAKADEFAAGDYDPKIGIDDTKARADLSSLQKELDRLGALTTKTNISLVDAEAKARLEALAERLREVGTKVTDAKVDVNDAEGRAKLAGFEADLLHVAARTAEPTIDLAGVAQAEAQLGILEGRLESFSHKRYVASVAVTGTERAARQTSFLIDAVATLGPAAVASSGVAVGAIGALGASMGVATVAGGVLGIAVAGTVSQMKKQEQAITAAHKALDGQTKGTAAYALALAKVNSLQRDFDTQFGPAADAFGEFQTTWHEFLADTSGTSDTVIAKALNLASLILPKLEGIVAAAGGSVEKLLDGLREFAQGPEAAAMLAFFQTHGPVAIQAFGSAIGNIGKGFVSLLMAFAPMQDGILGGLQSLTAGFADWAAQVGQTQGFQNFLAYIADTGPKVLDALGAISGALLAVLKAAAPIGSITLPILTELANDLALIARSPAGPTLVGIALALSAVNRALRTMEALKASNIALAIGKIGTETETAGAKALAAKAGFIAAGIGLEILASHIDDAHSSTKALLTIAGGAAIGAAFGPWGAVIGGAAGALQFLSGQMQQEADTAAAMQRQAQMVADTLNQQTGAITANTEASLRKSLADQGAYDDAAKLGISFQTVTLAASGNAAAMREFVSQAKSAADANGDLRFSAAHLWDIIEGQTGAFQDSARHIQQTRHEIDMANLAAHPFIASTAQLGKVMGQLGPDVAGVAPPVEHTAESFRQLAKDARDALAAMLAIDNQALGRQGDWDNFRASIDAASKALKDNGNTLDKNTEKGRANRAILRDMAASTLKLASDYKDGSKAQVNALEAGRTALYKQRIAFGDTKAEARKYVNTVLDIPDNMKTLADFEVADAMAKVEALQEKYDIAKLPVTTIVEAAGATTAAQQVKALLDYINALHNKSVDIFLNSHYTSTGSVGGGGGHVIVSPSGIAGGGYVRGAGTTTSDSIPAWLSDQEFVQKAAATQKYGLGLMHAINDLSLPLEFVRAAGYASGGSVGQSRVTDSMTRAQPMAMTVVIPGMGQAIDRMADRIVHLEETLVQHGIPLSNLGTLDNRTRHLAANEVAQNAAHDDTMAGMWA